MGNVDPLIQYLLYDRSKSKCSKCTGNISVIAMMKENESPRIMYTTVYLMKIGTGFVEKHRRVVIHTDQNKSGYWFRQRDRVFKSRNYFK